MRDSIQIRPAQPVDAEVAAVLLYSAYTHIQVTYPLPKEHESGFIERLQHFFRRDGNRFSYQNIQVADQSSEVVGLVLSFGGRDEARLNAAVGSWLEREAEDDEWYVDALSVFRNWGRKGIGACLLQRAEQQARQHHYPKTRSACRSREQTGIGSVCASALCCHPADLPLSTSLCTHGKNIGKLGTGKQRNGEYAESFSMNVRCSVAKEEKTMKIKRLGRMGLKVSEICLGTMTFGNQCREHALPLRLPRSSIVLATGRRRRCVPWTSSSGCVMSARCR